MSGVRDDYMREFGYKLGLEAAARKVIQQAEEGCGGAGKADERSKSLAEAIRNIDPSKGY